MSNLLGVVLCGGQSSRMGSDKGLLQTKGQTWAQLAAQKFAALPLPSVVSVAQHNSNAYAAVFSQNQLVIDDEHIAAGGPLKGILSVHQQAPDKDLVVMAVDMQQVTIALLQTLLLQASHRGIEAFAFQNGRQLEPLPGIYTAKGLRKILYKLKTGTLQRFSMQAVLQSLHTRIIIPDAVHAAAFTNYNAPEDLLHL